MFWYTRITLVLTVFIVPVLASADTVTYQTPGVYTYTVPAGVTSLHAYVWGAAGASGSGAGLIDGYWGIGGAGGYTEGTLAVSPGQRLTVTVGSGGVNGTTFGGTTARGTGGGGLAGGAGGAGGGMSAIYSGWTPLIIAGGGGGGAAGGSASGFSHYAGGAGGGLSGSAGAIAAGYGTYNCTTTGYDSDGNPIQSCGYSAMGQGGTQSSGGAHGTGGYTGTDGSYFQGGDVAPAGCYAGGGGGGGYYGGGSGSSSDYGCYSGFQNSGGGGSGFIGSSVQGGFTASGISVTPPNTNSPFYNGTAGRANTNNGAAGSGDDGLVVLGDCVQTTQTNGTYRVYIFCGNSWTVPDSWNSTSNTVEVIGGGGQGYVGQWFSPWLYQGGGGGGGGAYSAVSNVQLAPGASIPYHVAGPGDDTYFGATSFGSAFVASKGGGDGGGPGWHNPYGGAGGAASQGIGSVRYSGGTGGDGSTVNQTGSGAQGGGGGGAAGAHGNGGSGSSYQTGGTGDAGSGGTSDQWGVEWGPYGSGGGGNGGTNAGTAGSPGASFGAGGGGGGIAPDQVTSGSGAMGAPGIIVITWTSAPSCSVTFDQNPLAYGGTTVMHWTSSNATRVVIANYGDVIPNASGQTTLQNQTLSKDFTCTAVGASDTTTNPATLTIIPQPVLSITADSTSINVGQSSGIHATYAASAGDAATYTALNELPTGGSEFNLVNDGTAHTRDDYTFTPSTVGTYVFKPYILTTYFPAWTSVGQSVTVTVTNPTPSCTLSISPTSIQRGQSATLTWTSHNATSGSVAPGVGSVGPNGSATVSPTQSTTYTGTFSGSGGFTSCSPNARVTVACTESWTCVGQTIRHTFADCSTQDGTTCQAPSYCSEGSASCVNPTPVITAALKAVPGLVRAGLSSKLSWDISNVTSCTVSGNGRTWNTASGNALDTGPIMQQTIFTLTCTALPGGSFEPETATVNVLPIFIEL